MENKISSEFNSQIFFYTGFFSSVKLRLQTA